MNINLRRLLIAVLLLGLLLPAVALYAKERSEFPDQYKWDLAPLYPTVEALKQEQHRFLADAEKLSAYKGKLGLSAKKFQEALDLYYRLENRLRRMESYAYMAVDSDTRVSESKALKSEIETIRTKFSGIASFIDPEIVALGQKKVNGFLAKNPGLKNYRFGLSETFRRQKHILSQPEEKIMAAAQDLTGQPDSLYSLFTNADLTQDTVTLADGTKVKMSYAAYEKLRQSLVDSDRVLAFKTLFGQYDRFKRTLAEILYGQMKAHRFNATARHYDSTLAAALDYPGIDTRIYTSLIEAAHQNFGTFHRYLKLKARALGKTKLDYTDIYLPFTRDVSIPAPYPQAQELLLQALAPLGEEYVNTVREAFQQRWIDVYPNDGKDQGAYSNGWAYEIHPYILLNYNDLYGDLLTLAHEMGHTMHSYFSNKNQPFPTADYSTFVAEVASTFNENLMNDYMLKKVTSDQEKFYLLGNFLDNSIRGTFFRQIQFAEFELMIHQRVEKGEALTDDVLNKMFLDLARQYYGYDQGVADVPDFIAAEWSVIPHFYYNYYVYQYSTSIAAASLLSQKVLDGEPGARDAYYNHLLKAGGSDNPVRLLQQAGADMTNPAAYQALMDRANRYMDEMEKLLDKMEKAKKVAK